MKRLVTAEEIDVKHLRWVSEIIADGSTMHSLSGRSALLGDGYSRNPKERDALLEQRTKDLQGIAGQCRGSDIQEFCSDWERTDDKPIPWTFPSDSVPVPPGTPEASSVRKPAAPGKPRIRMAVLESDEEPARLVCPGLLEYRFMQAGITGRSTAGPATF